MTPCFGLFLNVLVVLTPATCDEIAHPYGACVFMSLQIGFVVETFISRRKTAMKWLFSRMGSKVSQFSIAAKYFVIYFATGLTETVVPSNLVIQTGFFFTIGNVKKSSILATNFFQLLSKHIYL